MKLLEHFTDFIDIIEQLLSEPFKMAGLNWRYIILSDWSRDSTSSEISADFSSPEDSLALPENNDAGDNLKPVSFDFALTYDADGARVKTIHKSLDNICREGI